MSKEERAKLALKRRQEEVDAQKKVLEETKASQQKYQEEANFGQSDRKRWEGREEEREKQREVTLLVKDKEKEVEAIKVTHCSTPDYKDFCFSRLVTIFRSRQETKKDAPVSRQEVCI